MPRRMAWRPTTTTAATRMLKLDMMTTAKNASVADYRRATGFEALMGYLYLTGQTDRMLELIQNGIRLAGLEI